MDKTAWELAGTRYLSELAADRNVRAPVVVPRRARKILLGKQGRKD